MIETGPERRATSESDGMANDFDSVNLARGMKQGGKVRAVSIVYYEYPPEADFGKLFRPIEKSPVCLTDGHHNGKLRQSLRRTHHEAFRATAG